MHKNLQQELTPVNRWAQALRRIRDWPRMAIPHARGLARDMLPGAIRLPLQRSRLWRRVVDGLPIEPEVIRFVQGTVRRGWRTVDLGGHVRRISLVLARLVGPTGLVYVFEAQPDNARRIDLLIRRHGLASFVRVENLAVSEGTETSVWLYAGRNNATEEWDIVGRDVTNIATRPHCEVRATSLDAYFDADEHIDFIKIDIEGAEHLALRGMRRILEKQRPILLIEFHPNGNLAAAAKELVRARYSLMDLQGRPTAALPRSAPWHCVAEPDP